MACILNQLFRRLLPARKENPKLDCRNMHPIMRESSYSLRGFQFLLMLFKFSGVAAISVHIDATNCNRDEDAGTLIFSCSKWQIIYNIVLTCCFTVNGIFILPKIYEIEYTNKVIVATVVELVTVVIAIFTVCSMILTVSARQRSALRISNKILDVNRFLIKYNSVATRIDFRLSVIFFLLHVILWIATFVSVKITYDYDLYHWVIHVGSTFVVYMFLAQYAMVVMVVKRKFQIVNRVLSNLLTFAEIQVPAILSRSALGCNPTVVKLKTLKDVHNSLCEICYELERFYSFPTFLGITFYFMTVLYDAYKFISSSLGYTEGASSVLTCLNSILWLIVETVALVMLSYNITNTIKEVSKAKIEYTVGLFNACDLIYTGVVKE